MARTVHVIGAGLAGLAAAVDLAERGERVIVHEALQQAGGRCRSYYDANTGLTIDNGNHLLLSGNRAALSYLGKLGSQGGMIGPPHADFPFMDLATRNRWTVRISDGRVPFWIFDKSRRVPDTAFTDYLAMAPLTWAGKDKLIGDVMACRGTLYDRLVKPVLLSALNIDPPQGSAALAGAIIRETLMAGGQACRPLVAVGLSEVFIDPALRYLAAHGAEVRFGAQLRAITVGEGRAAALDFGTGSVMLAGDDHVVLAVPPWVAAPLLPGLTTPNAYHPIVNAHFRVAPPAGLPPLMGVLNGTIEWLFAFPDRLSITISGADRLLDQSREELAALIWKDVAAIAGLGPELPPWQVVRERRATFAATPEQDARRPGPVTSWRNLYLAGDWTDTGLPATIEGAIRSGHRAAARVQ